MVTIGFDISRISRKRETTSAVYNAGKLYVLNYASQAHGCYGQTFLIAKVKPKVAPLEEEDTRRALKYIVSRIIGRRVDPTNLHSNGCNGMSLNPVTTGRNQSLTTSAAILLDTFAIATYLYPRLPFQSDCSRFLQSPNSFMLPSPAFYYNTYLPQTGAFASDSRLYTTTQGSCSPINPLDLYSSHPTYNPALRTLLLNC